MISKEQSQTLAAKFAKDFPDCEANIGKDLLAGWMQAEISAQLQSSRAPTAETRTEPIVPVVGDLNVIAYVQTSARGDRNLFLADDRRVEPFIRHGFNLVPLVDGAAASEKLAGHVAKLDNCGALIRKLVQSLRRASPGNDLSEKALSFLKRNDLQGSPLRSHTVKAEAVLPRGSDVDVG